MIDREGEKKCRLVPTGGFSTLGDQGHLGPYIARGLVE